MKQSELRQQLYKWLHEGARIQLNAVGVSFPCLWFTGNRQDVIREMFKCDCRDIRVYSQYDNEYDEYAMIVTNVEKMDIGFLPKQAKFSVFLPNRRRPLVYDKLDTGVNTNELFHESNSEIEEFVGEVTKFKSYQFEKDSTSNIGLSIEFWLPTP